MPLGCRERLVRAVQVALRRLELGTRALVDLHEALALVGALALELLGPCRLRRHRTQLALGLGCLGLGRITRLHDFLPVGRHLSILRGGALVLGAQRCLAAL